MAHRSKVHHSDKTHSSTFSPDSSPQAEKNKIDLVIKSDTDGCEQTVCNFINKDITVSGVSLEIIHKGVGDICKNDIMIAATGSRLVLGFNVRVLPKVEDLCKEQNVEVRLYSVIYRLQEDLKEIAESFLPQEENEKILATANVIALFKSSRKGIIIGCEVKKGIMRRGNRFRIISAMGTVYNGTISSMHIGKESVDMATPNQQVGVKIENFNNVRVGDIVECYSQTSGKKSKKWQPSGKIMYL